jgi:site-specific DNA-cytosine methylase
LCNFNLINQLKELPHPDIILASPPCESWSGADCGGKMFRSIDAHGNWKVMNSKYYDEYNKKCHPVKRRYFIQKERGRLLGEATIAGTIEIIKYFKPKV